jgi:hypothetical protein
VILCACTIVFVALCYNKNNDFENVCFLGFVCFDAPCFLCCYNVNWLHTILP